MWCDGKPPIAAKTKHVTPLGFLFFSKLLVYKHFTPAELLETRNTNFWELLPIVILCVLCIFVARFGCGCGRATYTQDNLILLSHIRTYCPRNTRNTRKDAKSFLVYLACLVGPG
jgi:hypothetical protein